ncbi:MULTISPECIES: hypothetical protein [unclassified Erwinia]|uniref:hypothetical protein n=1 Tax=unclassified Erwinia TaxID=2622719 RepID=UPI00082E6759|nr:hypothetical protein [Erwinia sp. ErVv1]
MITRKALFVLLTSVLVTSCSSVETKPNTVKAELSPTNKVIKAEKIEGRQCVDNFDLLKSLNYEAFTMYRKQFDAINASHSYYKKNENLLEQDPRELMTLTLNDKLNLICDRVKSQTFVEIRKKMLAVSKI